MISIIIPTYNREETLKRCVDSILDQYYEGLEIIIIDDCSQDDTVSYLKSLAQSFSFIKIVYNKINYGVNYSRNRGIELASKEYILFIDSDDELLQGGLNIIKRSIEVYNGVTHFLFIISDREKDFEKLTQPIQVSYKEWIKGHYSGDFTHVVQSNIMKQFLFYENFRLFEILNWLRIKRHTTPQLLIPEVTTKVERARSDSLTISTRLTNSSIISTTFEAQKLYYELFYHDLLKHNPKALASALLKTILLGIASGKKKECEILISYARKSHIKLAGMFCILIPPIALRKAIILFSSSKKFIT
jgi:glycosyltransferase involved in cell wall biosynthesis